MDAQRQQSQPQHKASFEVHVAKESFKFNAAHFVAFKGFRERLHGHNYKVSVSLLGSRHIGNDGYLLDFGNVKAVTKKVCKEMNEHFLCPMNSDVIKITEDDASNSIELLCEDGAKFLFPKDDCYLLPIVHATTEELAIYLWGRILSKLDAKFLLHRGIHTLQITVGEAIGQQASFRHEIPKDIDRNFMLDVKEFINTGYIVPVPCLPPPKKRKRDDEEESNSAKQTSNTTTKSKIASSVCCDANCEAAMCKFSLQMQKIVDAINDGKVNPQNNGQNGNKITVKDLEEIIEK